VRSGSTFLAEGRPAPSRKTPYASNSDWPLAAGLPAVIHQRQAEVEILTVFASEPALPPLILHSFDGSVRYADFAIEHGCLVGVGGLATRRGSSALREVLARIPAGQVVLETDAPFLVPAGVRGRRNTPASVALIGQRMAISGLSTYPSSQL
jgi:TatD DNase family protein